MSFATLASSTARDTMQSAGFSSCSVFPNTPISVTMPSVLTFPGTKSAASTNAAANGVAGWW